MRRAGCESLYEKAGILELKEFLMGRVQRRIISW